MINSSIFWRNRRKVLSGNTEKKFNSLGKSTSLKKKRNQTHKDKNIYKVFYAPAVIFSSESIKLKYKCKLQEVEKYLIKFFRRIQIPARRDRISNDGIRRSVNITIV